MWTFFAFALILLIAGVVVLRLSGREQARTGLPEGVVVYSDTRAWFRVERPLRSERYGIVGKPDYLVQVDHRGDPKTIPVEVKSRRRPPAPYDSHILQLGAYCLLVEELHNERPPCGYLRYADATIEIPFTDTLRRQVLETVDAIQSARKTSNVFRQHQEPARCTTCGYRHACGSEALSARY